MAQKTIIKIYEYFVMMNMLSLKQNCDKIKSNFMRGFTYVRITQ